MDDRTKLIIIAIAAACSLATTGGAILLLKDKGPHDPTSITVTDVRGRTVDVPTGIDEIACIAAGSVRLVEYMGAQNLIVGIDTAESKSSSGSFYEATYRIAYDVSKKTVIDPADPKGIIALDPDVIFWTTEDPDKLNSLQTSTNIPVIGLNAQGEITVTDDSFAQNINILGKALQREDRAKQLLDGINSIKDDLNSYASQVKDKVKSYIGGMMYFQNGDLLNTTGNYLPFTLGGVYNCMPYMDGRPYEAQLTQVATSGAEYFFIDNSNFNTCQTEYQDNKETLSATPAVSKNSSLEKRVFCLLSYKMYGTNWESELVNAYFIGKTVNWDTYDYDLTQKVNAVYSLFFPDAGLTLEKVKEKQTHGFDWLNW